MAGEVSSVKVKGADSIVYNASKGALLEGAVTLSANTWHKIKSFGESSALPELKVGSVFLTPMDEADEITLAEGDEVWPLTLTQICKVDVDMSGEQGTIDTTDSCDYPYVTSLPDGFTNLSGSISTMLRFDEETKALVPVTKELLIKFFDVIEDDGAGVYTLTPKNDDELLLFILINKGALDKEGQVSNWLIVPAILSSLSMPFAMKDVGKADYSWSKGQGPAGYYSRYTPIIS